MPFSTRMIVPNRHEKPIMKNVEVRKSREFMTESSKRES